VVYREVGSVPEELFLGREDSFLYRFTFSIGVEERK
jgi:hypothetical protein